MLRFVLLLLVCANVLYGVWSQGWLAAVGLAPQNQSEPWRLAQQMRPETITLVQPAAPAPRPEAAAQPPVPERAPEPAPEAVPPARPEPSPAEPAQTPEPPAATAAPASAPPASTSAEAAPAAPPALCLQAGPFDEDQARTLRTALRNQEFPWESYELRVGEIPGRWMVYLGKFPSLEVLAQRRSELRARGLDTDRAGGSLEPGLSLGRFSTEEAATRELTRILRAGVRGARVVQERPASTVYTLQLPAVSSALQAKLKAIEPALAGKALRVCNKPDGKTDGKPENKSD